MMSSEEDSIFEQDSVIDSNEETSGSFEDQLKVVESQESQDESIFFKKRRNTVPIIDSDMSSSGSTTMSENHDASYDSNVSNKLIIDESFESPVEVDSDTGKTDSGVGESLNNMKEEEPIIEIVGDISNDNISDSDIIDISSNEVTPVKPSRSHQKTLLDFYSTKTVLKDIVNNEDKFKEARQRSLSKDSTLNKENIQSTNFSNRKESTQLNYNDQKLKVQTLKAEFDKIKRFVQNVDVTGLPDKGQLLLEKYERLSKEYLEEEEKLKELSSRVGEKPNIPTVKWEELASTSEAVQPKTFGKKALETHNIQKSMTMDRLEQLHSSLKTCPTEHEQAEDPNGLKIDLMPHQKHALAWLSWRETQKPSGGILADDMGLGKTMSMISLVLKSKQNPSDIEVSSNSKFPGGTLVICPASLMNQWADEIDRRVRRGLLDVELYHGPKREPKAKRLAKYDMVITTYNIVMHDHHKPERSPLYGIKWRRIIIDEGHQVRNYKSATALAVCELTGKSRWVLTGTPIHNKELDLYALLKFLRCSPFDDLTIWKKWVSNKTTGGQDRLNTVIASLILRRTKAQLQDKGSLQCLPSKEWALIEVGMGKEEMSVYEKVLIFSRTLFAQFLHQRAEQRQDALEYHKLNDPNSEYAKMHKRLVRLNGIKNIKQHEILVLLLRLRQICCHPCLISGMLENTDIENVELEGEDECMNILEQINKLSLEDEPEHHDEVEALGVQEGTGLSEAAKGFFSLSSPVFRKSTRSSKIKAMLQVLREKVLPEDDKAIIVSQWTSFLKVISQHLDDESIHYEQLDGSIPVPKRMAIIDNFNSSQHKSKVLLLSLTAGGVGLNLTGANHLFLLDLHWNPQLEMQAQDRIYRMGQKKAVYVYKFMTTGTIEERIKKLQETKLNMANDLLRGAKVQQTKLSLDDLKMLFNM